MSRSYCTYDEEWQRRKSVMIRSLFHDVPILSPVEEESTDSSHDYYVPVLTQEVFPSPPRPYSPLPPLIIEKIPVTNKHDEPEEFYRKLHKRIKLIYEKLFIEKRNVSSVDFDSNYNDSSVNDDSEYNTDNSAENLVHETVNNSPENDNESIIEDREARQSSASTKSNGYGADYESMDTTVIDIVNHTLSNEDIIMVSEEEESESNNIDELGMRDEDFCKNKESSRERLDDQVESQHSIIDDPIEKEDAHDTEQSDETEGSDTVIIEEQEIIKETNQTRRTNTVKIVDLELLEVTGRVETHSTVSDQEIMATDKSDGKEDYVTTAERKSLEKRSKLSEFGRRGFEGRHELTASIDEPMEADVETSLWSDGPHYRQITTEALIHFDASQVPGERESIVYEDSVKSVILPTRSRREVVSRNVDVEDRIEAYAVLEENADPKIASTLDIGENETTDEELEEVTSSHSDTSLENGEEMSTHQPDAIEESDKEMSASQSDGNDRDFEEICIRQTGAIEEDVEEINVPQSDVSEEIYTNQPESTHMEIEESVNLDTDDIPEENEECHQLIDAGEDTRQMRSHGLDTIEEDDEEMSTSQAEEDVEVDIEETGTPLKDVSSKISEEMSDHQLVADEDTEERTIPRLDDSDIEEMRDPTTDFTSEKETAYPNTRKINTPASETNMEYIRISETEFTEKEIEQKRTKESKSIVEEMRTHEPAQQNSEELESPHSLELMRTPRPDLSHVTIPITQRSFSASSSEHIALPQELTVMTLSTQNGAENNVSELQTSNDVNEILTSILNDSQNKNETPISGRKRKLVDKSVQAVETGRVTWEEMRANFFIGTPKIFRLCACTDHICSKFI